MTASEYAHEFISAVRALRHFSFQEPAERTDGPPARILAGFVPFAHYLPAQSFMRRLYGGMAHHLTRCGFRVIISEVDGSTMPFRSSIRALNCEADRKFGKGTPVIEIGHSLGGVLALGRLIFNEAGVARVITVGTPNLGTPLDWLAKAVFQATKISPKLFDHYRDPILAHSEKVVVIRSKSDLVAPPKQCAIEGYNGTPSRAIHVDLDKVFPGSTIGHTELAHDKRVFELIEHHAKKST